MQQVVSSKLYLIVSTWHYKGIQDRFISSILSFSLYTAVVTMHYSRGSYNCAFIFHSCAVTVKSHCTLHRSVYMHCVHVLI